MIGALFKWLGVFFGELLDRALPTIVREWKKPKDAKMVGGDKDLIDDMDADITAALDNERERDLPQPGRLGPNAMREDYVEVLEEMFPKGALIVYNKRNGGDKWQIWWDDKHSPVYDTIVLNELAQHLRDVLPDILTSANEDMEDA